jgi:predicted signal transduction protein with EAL and GGDEF domain
MEFAATGHLSLGLNLPTFIAACGLLRMWQWYGRASSRDPAHELMVQRMRQTVWFSSIVCVAVCARCLYLLQVGDDASHMAVMLFGGLTGIGVAYGLTALPAAGLIPLLLIIGPMSAAALLSREPRFAGAAFGLVVVAALTMRLLGAHSRHFTTVIRSRSSIAREQELVEHARHRFSDRPSQPPGVRRGARHGNLGRRRLLRTRDPRPRPFQDGQRYLRARYRRPALERGFRKAGESGRKPRPRRPARRR